MHTMYVDNHAVVAAWEEEGFRCSKKKPQPKYVMISEITRWENIN